MGDYANTDRTDNAEDSAESLDECAAEMVLECKENSLRFYDEKFKKFNYFDRLYIKGSAKRNTPRGRANLELPTVFQQIEPFVSQLTETMVGEAPYIEYEGRTEADVDPAKQITEFSQYQLDEGEFLRAWCSWARNLGKHGTSTMKVLWDTEVMEIEEEVEEDSIVIDPATGEQTIQKIKRVNKTPHKKFDGLKFTNISVFDYFVPPSATSTNNQELEWCIHRTYRTLDQLLSNENYKNKKKLKELKQKLSDDDDSNSVPAKNGFDTYKDTQLVQNNDKGLSKFAGKFEVLEWWGDYSLSEKGEAEPCLIVVALVDNEDPIVLRCEKNPLRYKFKPFISANDYPIEGEFYGYGEIDHIQGLVQESTALRNARLDAANMSLNHMWLVERQSGINVRNLYSAPNHVILTDDMNGMREISHSGSTPSSVEELGRIDYDIQNTTEIINPRQDASNMGAAFGGTATGVKFLGARSNLRMLLKARLLEFTFFKPLANMMNMYNKQFVTDEMYFRAYEDNEVNPYTNPRTIGPEAFDTQVDYKPKSSPEKMSRDEKRGNMDYLLQVIAQIEGVDPGVNNFRELLPDIYKIAGFPHPNRYINPPSTKVMQTPDGQVIDKYGKPVEIIPVDEKGQPLPQQQPMPGAGGMMPQ